MIPNEKIRKKLRIVSSFELINELIHKLKKLANIDIFLILSIKKLKVFKNNEKKLNKNHFYLFKVFYF
jgi:hypothetical protein